MAELFLQCSFGRTNTPSGSSAHLRSWDTVHSYQLSCTNCCPGDQIKTGSVFLEEKQGICLQCSKEPQDFAACCELRCTGRWWKRVSCNCFWSGSIFQLVPLDKWCFKLQRLTSQLCIYLEGWPCSLNKPSLLKWLFLICLIETFLFWLIFLA